MSNNKNDDRKDLSEVIDKKNTNPDEPIEENLNEVLHVEDNNK